MIDLLAASAKIELSPFSDESFGAGGENTDCVAVDLFKFCKILRISGGTGLKFLEISFIILLDLGSSAWLWCKYAELGSTSFI